MSDSPEFDPANLLAAIHIVSNRIGRAFAADLTTRFGLSISEWRIILSLVEKPAQSARDITRAWGMEKMAANRAVRRLEEDGVVTAEGDPADRRRRLLKLTPSGQALYRKVEPAATARYREITDELTAREKASLVRILGKLVRGTDRLV